MTGWEHNARWRWVEWYQNFARRHGGQDWSGWPASYDAIDEEWGNFREVFEWCADNIEHYGPILESFWRHDQLAEYANIYGRWTDRLKWLRWRMNYARARMAVSGEAALSDYLDAAAASAYTLIHIGGERELDEAQRILTAGWSGIHSPPAIDLRVRCDLANALVMLYLAPARQNHAEAERWLDEHERLINEPDAALALDDREIKRQRVNLHYYRGIMSFRQGQDHFEDAWQDFERVRRTGEDIGWRRAVLYARNWQADILIETRGDTIAVDRLLDGYESDECVRDRRRHAHYSASLAKLAWARKNPDKARRNADIAYEAFANMRMWQEMKEMEELQRMFDNPG